MKIDKEFILYCFLVLLAGVSAIVFIVSMAIIISRIY